MDRFFTDLDSGLGGAGPVAALARRFGITAGVAWSETTDPKLVVALPNNLDVWVEQPNDPGRSVLEAVEVEAHRPDNIEKLERSRATGRHLLIWVDVDDRCGMVMREVGSAAKAFGSSMAMAAPPWPVRVLACASLPRATQTLRRQFSRERPPYQAGRGTVESGSAVNDAQAVTAAMGGN